MLTGETECLACAARNAKASLRPETVLILCFPALLRFFAVTSFAVRRYNAKEQALGEQWFSKGQAALHQGLAVEAIEDFRTALAYSRDNSEYQLQLALALIAGKRPDEARSYLLSLWNTEPESGPINLELGRLSAARAELMALAADLPPEAALHIQTGNLFLSTRDYDEALQEFPQALLLDGNHPAVQAGAGEAAFRKADYLEAQRYLERAARAEPEKAEAVPLLETTNSILEIDPFDPQLSPEERSRRAVRAYNQSLTRLKSCAQRHEVLDTEQPQTTLQTAYALAKKMQPQVREGNLRGDHEATTAVINLALEIQEIAARSCGPLSGWTGPFCLSPRSTEEPNRDRIAEP